MAVAFSVPQYLPDQNSGETVVGYQVQSLAPVAGLSTSLGNWTDLNGGQPFTSNLNIFDPAGTVDTSYRVKPVRQVTYQNQVYTLDTPWSRPILSSTPVYDAVFTRLLLPALRFVYLADQGVPQTNGTVLNETQGAGDGLWVFDGKTTRFNLQYVMNDDPIMVLNDLYRLTYHDASGNPVAKQPYVDYIVHERQGVVEFATPPAAGEYARFEFRQCDFLNDDLMQSLASAVNALSMFGKGGYQINAFQNLRTLNTALEAPDLGEILCHIAIYLMREGLSEQALRQATSWRDGSESVDPWGSRGLEAVVNKLQISEDMIRRKVAGYNRMKSVATGYGDFDVFWNLSELTPLVSGMFNSMLPGYFAAGMMVAPYWSWWM